MAKIWENRNGKCYCHGQLMTNPGCHGANCRTCCYGLGKSEAGSPTIPPINPGTPARKVWENVDGKCYCYGVLMSNPGCHGANCRTCCYSLGKREAGSPTIPFPPTDPGAPARKIWQNINGKCHCHGRLMTNSGCHGANCRTCCYNLGKSDIGSPYTPPPPINPRPQVHLDEEELLEHFEIIKKRNNKQ